MIGKHHIDKMRTQFAYQLTEGARTKNDFYIIAPCERLQKLYLKVTGKRRQSPNAQDLPLTLPRIR